MSQLHDISTFLEEVYANLDPEDVFENGEFDHSWNKTRDKWRGKCPWHDSKSGTAFYVDLDSLTWRCPSCDRGGGPIQYLYQVRGGVGSPRGKQFLDIAKELGDVSGVDLPERELTEDERKLLQQLENRRSMLESVASFCHKLLMTESTIGIKYLTEERGLTRPEIENLQLGAFPGGQVVAEMLVEKGFSIDDAIECGLVYEHKDSNGNTKYGSSLSGYIIFPWNDENGRLLTLYGRWPAKDHPRDKSKKTRSLKNPTTGDEVWLKSKKSPLYLDRALAAGHKDLIVVEGLFDAAILQVRGETRAFAWVAANASEDQIQTLIKCRVQSVTFCLDPDKGGKQGTGRGIEHLTKAGIPTYATVELPDGKDPDEFVNTNGMDGWYAHVETRIHGLRFKAREILAANDADTDKGRQMAIAAGREFCKDMPEAMKDQIDTFFWDEFKQQTGLELATPKSRSSELKTAVAELERVRDPFERALLEIQIKQEFKVSSELLRSLERVTSSGAKAQEPVFANSLRSAIADLEEQSKNPGMQGIPSGFNALDNMTGGWRRKTLNVIAGRPSMGKTGMLLGCALNAVKSGYKTTIVSVESGQKELIDRILSSELSIDGNKFTTNTLDQNDLRRIRSREDELAKLPIWIYEEGISTLAQIEDICEERKASSAGLDLVLVDYLQLVNHPGYSNRNYELGAISRSLKELARRLDIAVICISQLSRNVEGRAGNRPVMSDLRDSGAIESDADVICMLYREDYYKPDIAPRGVTEIIVAKNRNGPVGVVELMFKAEYTRFENSKPSVRTEFKRTDDVDVPFGEVEEF